MEKKYYETVSEAVNDLYKMGYTEDLAIMAEKDCLICHKTGVELPPEEFEIDAFYRFEGETDPGDEMIVYAISSKNSDLKGIVVNGFGTYADSFSSALVKKLDTGIR